MNLGSILRLLEMAGGGFLVGWANDTYTAPFLESQLAVLQSDHTMAKATDTVSTYATAVGLGYVGRRIGLAQAAQAVEDGGKFVAALKGISVLIPGVEVKLTTPSPLSLVRATLGQLQAPVVTTASQTTRMLPSGETVAAAGMSATPNGTTNYPAAGIPQQYITGGSGVLGSANTAVGY